MYSSLDKIDIVIGDRAGRPNGIVLTDHRERAAIEAEPEISVLFALTRAIEGRRALVTQGHQVQLVRYMAKGEVPRFLAEALASVGAVVGNVPAPAAEGCEPPETFAARAMVGLARRVAARTGLTDPAAVLRVLEAETVASPPSRADDEVGFWTRVVELMAVFGAVVAATRSVRWVPAAGHSDVPFGLALDDASTMLPCNRAIRLIESGARETLFVLIAGIGEVRAGDADRPLLPSLRSRADAKELGLLWTPLVDAESDAAPVVAYGRDGEHSFSLLLRERATAPVDEIHAEAIANLGAQEVVVVEQGADARILVVREGWFATEKLLDGAFMRSLHQRLGAAELIVGVPRREQMLVMAANESPAKRSEFRSLVETTFADAGGRAISPCVLRVRDRRVVALDMPDALAPSAPAKPERPGWFARLFRRARRD